MATAFDKLYWTRVGWGVLFGALVFYLQSAYKLDTPTGITLGILGYLVSYYLARFAWFRKVDQTNASKIYTTGIGAYVMMFVFTWLLLFTLSLVEV